jgi:hypothetical protein
MARKCLRKLIVLMMEFIILGVLAVQANDLTPPSLSTSSRPIRLLHPSEPAASDRDKNPLSYCLETRMKHCETIHDYGTLGFSKCIKYHFFRCLYSTLEKKLRLKFMISPKGA